MLNQRFHHCLSQCKQLNGQSLNGQLGDSNTAQLTADKLLYNHAIDLVCWPSSLLQERIHKLISFSVLLLQCQSAALDELFGNPASCCRRYQTAHILFHSLAQQVTQHGDKSILNKCKFLVVLMFALLVSQSLIHFLQTVKLLRNVCLYCNNKASSTPTTLRDL